jgi:hypothetical protein
LVTTLVSGFFNWTFALGTTAPAGSFTVPWILPLNCAQQAAVTRSERTTKRITEHRELGDI